MINGVICCAAALCAGAGSAFGTRTPPYLIVIDLLLLLPFLLGLEQIVAGRGMRTLRGHTQAVAGCVFALFSGIGLPFGIWALVLLSRREVREAFEEEPAAKPPWPAAKLQKVALSLFGAGGAVALGVGLFCWLCPRSYHAEAMIQIPSANIESPEFRRMLSEGASSEELATLDLRPVRNTDLIQVSAWAHDPQTAAQWVNAAIVRLQASARDRNIRVLVLEQAEPPSEPARPNVPGIIGITSFFIEPLLLGPGFVLLVLAASRSKRETP